MHRFHFISSLLMMLLLLLGGPAVYGQYSGDDFYDPFADYSEFDAATEEEADINFFKNGRFVNIGLFAGMRNFTGTYGDIYASAPNVGLFLSYFFDLRFAMQVSYVTGNHVLAIATPDEDITGTLNLSTISFSMKYYLNTQNVTRGLAALNPYLLGGFSRTDRTIAVSGESAIARDSANGFDVGLGIEIPVSRNDMFIGLQAWYYLVTFEDENQPLRANFGGQTDRPVGITPAGDIMNVLAIFGVNF